MPEELKELVGADTIKQVAAIIDQFDEIKTSKELLAYYNDNNELLGELLMPVASSLYYGGTNLSEQDLNCALGAFEFAGLCSECGEALYIQNMVFEEKAKTTSGKIDDEIFQLMYDAVGEYNSFAIGDLSEHDCDFCWHSILGDGQILAFWKRVAKIWEWHRDNQAAVEMEPVMTQIAKYLLFEMESITYVYPKEKVLAEYDEIIKVLKKVDWYMAQDIAFGKESLRARIEKGKGLTFNCENEDCATIVMEELFPGN